MKTIIRISLLTLMIVLAYSADAQSGPTSAPVPTAAPRIQVTATPAIVTTYQVGQTATVQFRARVDTLTTNNLFALPVVVATFDLQGHDVTAATTNCQLKSGVCTVRSDKPQVLLLTVLQNGVFGIQQVTLNFVNLRSNFPASVDVTASMVQAQEGAYTTIIATSPVFVQGPVTVLADTMFTEPSDTFHGFAFFPDGLAYGQRIQINTDTEYPLSFRDRRQFRVQIMGNSGNLIAEGYGNSVGLMEWRNLDATLDDNGDLVVVMDGPYSGSVDYTMTLLRGDQFRVELAQSRGEIFVYPQGGKTKIVFNRGSLGENMYVLQNGFYTVNVTMLDRSNGIRFNQSRADALGLNGQFRLQ